MSRVEPKERPARREAGPGRSSSPSRTPGKAEGDERTVEEALRNQEKRSK